MPGDLRWYCVHISTAASRERGTSICWSAPCLTKRDANILGRELVREGKAVLAFLIEAQGDEREMLGVIAPPNAAKTIRHYENVLDALQRESRWKPGEVTCDHHGQEWMGDPPTEPIA